MDSEQIKQLLEKYWNCESTLEEETALRDFFHQTEVDNELKESAALFRYFENQRKQKIADTNFEISLQNKLQPAQVKLRSLIFTSLRMAAGIGVVVASFWLVRAQIRDSAPVEVADTYNDPKKAFEETKRALQLISKNFGRAEKAAININLLNEATTKLQTKEERKIDS